MPQFYSDWCFMGRLESKLMNLRPVYLIHLFNLFVDVEHVKCHARKLSNYSFTYLANMLHVDTQAFSLV